MRKKIVFDGMKMYIIYRETHSSVEEMTDGENILDTSNKDV
jgi:hypothetical protein